MAHLAAWSDSDRGGMDKPDLDPEYSSDIGCPIEKKTGRAAMGTRMIQFDQIWDLK